LTGDNPHLANLSDVVTSPEGVGLLEVVVTAHISDTWGWQEIHQTRTITDGIYTLRALPVGEYAIRFPAVLNLKMAQQMAEVRTCTPQP
jgi:hypothetical protein